MNLYLRLGHRDCFRNHCVWTNLHGTVGLRPHPPTQTKPPQPHPPSHTVLTDPRSEGWTQQLHLLTGAAGSRSLSESWWNHRMSSTKLHTGLTIKTLCNCRHEVRYFRRYTLSYGYIHAQHSECKCEIDVTFRWFPHCLISKFRLKYKLQNFLEKSKIQITE